MTGKSGKGTARQTIRAEEDLWSTFGDRTKTQGTDRSAVLRDFMRWYNGDPDAELPDRPRRAHTAGNQPSGDAS